MREICTSGSVRGGDGNVPTYSAQLALAGHRRDQAEIGPPVVDPHLRRPAAGRVTAAAHVIGAQAGLVTPEDGATLHLGPGSDGWAVPAQPAPHRRRVRLVGSPQRLLRGKPQRAR